MDVFSNPDLPISSQKEQLFKSGNLTEHAFKILENKGRVLRSPTAAVMKSIANLSTQNQYYNRDTQVNVWDGEIDITANYTGFLEIVVRDRDSVFMAYSDYFDIITPATEAEQIHELSMDYYFNIWIKQKTLCLVKTL
ncbi:uncharacterized protein Dwil_GK25460 [Drosophila willistoni]|uniref:Uncharacterized protein n=1 Tax=Drosophila willistoni TaxID=7260 RepID=A0A0Q9WUK0_DROWI|nr:uncharacterized protein Dwil_GK25460 [Drosophila willistoni]